MQANLKEPTNGLIDEYIKKFDNNERYYSADQAIIKLFNAFPKNKSFEEILLKISAVNNMYSTNILGTFSMAKHIRMLNIDEELLNGDPDLVRKIATGHRIRTKKTNKELNFYSFATKYCNWHNKAKYPIYDSFVEKTLLAYKSEAEFSDFKREDLRDFKTFKSIIGDFVNFYSLKRHDLKQIDKFLWLYGREISSK